MKTSRHAYKLMKRLFDLIDSQFSFVWGDDGLIDSPKDKRSFQYLREAGYVRKLGDGRFQATELAQINFLRELAAKRKPDRRLRIVIFDIPEELKRNRNFFRRHLVELGFKMQQQSVWVSKLPCEDLVRKVVHYHGLGKFVELIVGELVPIR